MKIRLAIDGDDRAMSSRKATKNDNVADALKAMEEKAMEEKMKKFNLGG